MVPRRRDGRKTSVAINRGLRTESRKHGPHWHRHTISGNFRRRIEAGQPVIINGDGSQRRDLTHVSDVARAVGLALRWQGAGSVVLNVGTGKNHSVMDMLEAATDTLLESFRARLKLPDGRILLFEYT
jgi:nucleoside-diphosphate-sugar epimerase